MNANGSIFNRELSRLRDLEEIVRQDPDFGIHCIAEGWGLVDAKTEWCHKLKYTIEELKAEIKEIEGHALFKKEK